MVILFSKGRCFNLFKGKNITLSVAAIVVSISIAIVIITGGIAIRSNENYDEEKWLIRSYGNNVALYKGEQVIEVYGAISLDTLPESDKRLLENGIVFPTREEALSAIEDYDG